MDLQYLRRLLKIFDESSAVDLRIEEEGIQLRISKQTGQQTGMQAMPHYVQMQHTPPPAQHHAPSVSHEEPKAPVPAPPAQPENVHQIVSPIVGTFYRSPSPDSEPFVQVGDHVSLGSPLCIVEAMKLMNEIESDVAGRVIRVMAENGQPVEYGQPLFQIELE